MLVLYPEWLNMCKRSLSLSSNCHFLFLYLFPGLTSSFSVPTEAIGLYNVGHSCCLNSLLQVFFMNIRFTRILRRYHWFELPNILPLLLCCLHSFFLHDVHLKAWIIKVLTKCFQLIQQGLCLVVSVTHRLGAAKVAVADDLLVISDSCAICTLVSYSLQLNLQDLYLPFS